MDTTTLKNNDAVDALKLFGLTTLLIVTSILFIPSIIYTIVVVATESWDPWGWNVLSAVIIEAWLFLFVDIRRTIKFNRDSAI